ncbi:MAG: type II toxin-antitoxin system PemK/MazF family toxin [Candidatus Baltobacteraceae bacterium]
MGGHAWGWPKRRIRRPVRRAVSDAPVRGGVWYVALDRTIGSEQAKTRPCLVVQRDSANASSATTIVCPLSSAHGKTANVLNVLVRRPEAQLKKDSLIVLNQIRTVDQLRLCGQMLGRVSEKTMASVDEGLRAILDLRDN